MSSRPGLRVCSFPIVLVLGLTGIVVGILNSYDHFTVPALSPVAWNLVILLGLALGAEHTPNKSTRLYFYAVAILVATIVQFLLPLPSAARQRRPVTDGDRHPRPGGETDVRADGAGDDRSRADQHQRGNRSALRDALSQADTRPRRDRPCVPLYMLPQGMFSVAVATVLFLAVAGRLREDWAGFRSTVVTGFA